MPLARGTLVTHCYKDLGFMDFICSLVTKSVKVSHESVVECVNSYKMIARSEKGNIQWNLEEVSMLKCLLLGCVSRWRVSLFTKRYFLQKYISLLLVKFQLW